jgi:hypothetical protein
MDSLPKRILVVQTGSILDEGIKTLIMNEPNLQAATVTYTDHHAFLEQGAYTHHDVLLLSEASPLDWIHTSQILRGISPWKNLRVIIIRLEDNLLEVYDKQCLKMTHNSDLISFITHH